MTSSSEHPIATRRTNLYLTLVAAGVLLVGAALFPWLIQAQQAALDGSAPVLAPATVDFPAPQLVSTDLFGRQASLADYRGRIVLVNNWATWCPPCKAEMPELLSYYQAHSSQGFVVVAIEAGDAAQQVREFARNLGLTFPIWTDPSSTFLDAFRNWGLPSSYLIDRQGTVRMAWAGEINRETLEHFVTPLLRK